MIFLDYQAVQKRLEELLLAAVATVAATGPISLVFMGEDPPNESVRRVRFQRLRFESTKRNRTEREPDRQKFFLTLELSINEAVGNPARTDGTAHASAYMASVIRHGCDCTSSASNGLTVSVLDVETDLGGLVDTLTEAPVSIMMITGEATQETTALIAEPGVATDS